MRTLTAIDPSIRTTGVAHLRGGVLHSCSLVQAPTRLSSAPLPERVAWMVSAIRQAAPQAQEVWIEWPQVYKYRGSKGDPNDLLPITAVIGGLIPHYGMSVRLVKPAEWKGQVPKEAHNARTLAGLTQTEKGVLEATKCAASLRHNVIDAIALAQYGASRVRNV